MMLPTPTVVILKTTSAKRSPAYASQQLSLFSHLSNSIPNAVRENEASELAQTNLTAPAVIFFRTHKPLEPVSFVHSICKDITDGAQLRNLRYVKRLTPITAYEKATQQGLEAVAKQVLAPHFHTPDLECKKVRPLFNVLALLEYLGQVY